MLAIHGAEKAPLNHDHWLWAHPAVDLVMCIIVMWQAKGYSRKTEGIFTPSSYHYIL